MPIYVLNSLLKCLLGCLGVANKVLANAATVCVASDASNDVLATDFGGGQTVMVIAAMNVLGSSLHLHYISVIT